MFINRKRDLVSDVGVELSACLSHCQGPSHGGSYMDEGTSYIRIGLLLHVVTGDCLASYSMPLSRTLLNFFLFTYVCCTAGHVTGPVLFLLS